MRTFSYRTSCRNNMTVAFHGLRLQAGKGAENSSQKCFRKGEFEIMFGADLTK